MLGLATTKDLEFVEESIKDLTKEVGKLQHSLQLMVKKVLIVLSHFLISLHLFSSSRNFFLYI